MPPKDATIAKPEPSYLQWRILRFMSTASGCEEERWFSVENSVFFSGTPFNDRLVKEVFPAAKELVGGPLVEEFHTEDSRFDIKSRQMVPIRYGPRYRLSAAGRALAMGAEPTWTPPIPKLGSDDLVLLRSLACQPEVWRKPMDCGGSNGSRHSVRLFRLTLNGLAEMRKNGGTAVSGPASGAKPHLFRRGKGSRSFRITPAGLACLSS
jgi:hypothetical protein